MVFVGKTEICKKFKVIISQVTIMYNRHRLRNLLPKVSRLENSRSKMKCFDDFTEHFILLPIVRENPPGFSLSGFAAIHFRRCQGNKKSKSKSKSFSWNFCLMVATNKTSFYWYAPSLFDLRIMLKNNLHS